MQTVEIGTEPLSKILKENRSKHREVFEKALEGYRAQVITHLGVMIEDAKAGRRILRHIELPEPVDQTRDYDRAIKMCELSVSPTVKLSEREFAQYVMDDWAWKEGFVNTASNYL